MLRFSYQNLHRHVPVYLPYTRDENRGLHIHPATARIALFDSINFTAVVDIFNAITLFSAKGKASYHPIDH